jgi:hypothetical protein
MLSAGSFAAIRFADEFLRPTSFFGLTTKLYLKSYGLAALARRYGRKEAVNTLNRLC